MVVTEGRDYAGSRELLAMKLHSSGVITSTENSSSNLRLSLSLGKGKNNKERDFEKHCHMLWLSNLSQGGNGSQYGFNKGKKKC